MELSDVILHGCQLPFSELAFCALVAVLLQDVWAGGLPVVEQHAGVVVTVLIRGVE